MAELGNETLPYVPECKFTSKPIGVCLQANHGIGVCENT